MKRIAFTSLLSIILMVVLSIELYSQQKILTLNEALEIAYESSPSLIQSKISLERSENDLEIQKASLKSLFAFNLQPISYSRGSSYENLTSEWNTYENLGSSGSFSIRQPIAWTDGVLTLTDRFGWDQNQNKTYNSGKNTSFSNGITLGISQPIFTYNRTKIQLAQQEFALELAKISYALEQLSIERTVTAAFYQIYQAQRNLKTAEDEFKNQQQNYEIIKNKVEAGLIAREELYQAEVNYADAEISFSDSETNLENLKDGFKITLGLPLDYDFTVFHRAAINPIVVNEQEAIKHALSQRMEIRRNEISYEQGLFNLISAKATNEFSGNINAQIGFEGRGSKVKNAFEKLSQTQNISLSLEIPVWDWGVRRNTIRNAELSLESTLLTNEENEKQIILDIRQLLRNLPKLEAQVEIAKKKVENAEMAYEINTIKYREGTISGMDLQQYQNQLSSAQMSLTSSIISYNTELLNLKIQTLWDFETDTSYLPVDLIK